MSLEDAIAHCEEARKFILKHNCSPFSDIVKYYYSNDIDCGCKVIIQQYMLGDNLNNYGRI